MSIAFEQVYESVRQWAESHGIRIHDEALPPGKAGNFDGLTVTMNRNYGVEERLYYLAHALGSIVRWSLSKDAVQRTFDELRAAKGEKETDPARLERAIERYRAFEIESSEFAVWIFLAHDHPEVMPPYTNFMRADLEALTEFHRSGRAPVWRDFLTRWNEQVASGETEVLPFHPKPIPTFTPRHIDNQEILQQQPRE